MESNKPSVKTLDFIKEHIGDDVHKLLLQASRYSDIDVSYAALQISCRKQIKDKLPAWYADFNLIFPSKLSAEQCSSEATAFYKSTLCKGHTLIDMTGGLGVDTCFLSSNFQKVIYIEQNETLYEAVRKNFAALNKTHIEAKCGNSLDFLQEIKKVDCIYIDPARRNENNKKQVRLEDCSPNLPEIKDLLLQKSDQLLIKLSPLFDLTELSKYFPENIDFHIISVKNECKEVLIDIRKNQSESSYHCINFLANGEMQIFSFKKEEENNAVVELTSAPELFIYEPNASILKAGAFKLLGQRLGLKKFHRHSHLYTSSEWIPDFQGRSFHFIDMFSLQKDDIKKLLQITRKANITVRNFPISVDELRKKTTLQEGGSYYIFATTLASDQKVLLLTERETIR